MSSRYATCPVCGHRLRRVRDIFGNWDGESYECDFCDGFECDDDYDDEDYGERYDVHDAALAWLSSGMDEDSTFGYSEDELRDALK